MDRKAEAVSMRDGSEGAKRSRIEAAAPSLPPIPLSYRRRRQRREPPPGRRNPRRTYERDH
jgi:hypothetical protein